MYPVLQCRCARTAEISYGPGGASRGIAHVIFHNADGATKAYNTLNGLLIDNRPVKVRFTILARFALVYLLDLTDRLLEVLL